VREPEWIEPDVVLAIHEAQLAENGGAVGIRDDGLLESALARPKNLYSYSGKPDLAELAAAYAAGIARNHPFVDGNKRTAWVLCAIFLELNGVAVIADQGEVVQTMVALANGTLSEAQLVDWLKQTNVTAAPTRKRHA
jgi:death on curing protein